MYKKEGERLKHVRKDILGISSSYDIAEELGISQSAYINYETGKRLISSEVLEKMYSKYKILPNYLLLGKNPIKEGQEEKQNLVTDISKMKAQILVLTSQVEFLASRDRKK